MESSPARNREGYEIGPDILRSLPADGDILNETTPLPPAGTVPDDWAAVARGYFADMETLGGAILDALSRYLDINPAIFCGAFRDGISTLRLLHYPGETAPASADDVANRFVEIDRARVGRPRVHMSTAVCSPFWRNTVSAGCRPSPGTAAGATCRCATTVSR